jgi:hypothetical protein
MALPRELEWQVFRGSTAISRGLLTGNQLRGRAVVRLRHDVYADARLDVDHALACRAVYARLPAGSAVLAGPSAAYLHGIRHAAGPADPIRAILVPPHRVGSQQDLRLHRVRLDDEDVIEVDGLRLTAVPRTAWDVAVWLPPPRAVAVIDTMLARGLLTPEVLDDTAARLAERPGGRRATRAFELADAATPAPAESALRVSLVLTGLPQPRVRPSIMVRLGRTIHPGLAWPAQRVALDYDGPLYRERRDLLEADGWLVLQASRRSPSLAQEVREALIERGWEPPGARPRPAAHPVNGSRRRVEGRLGGGGPPG